MMAFDVCIKLGTAPLSKTDWGNNDFNISYKLVTLIVSNTWLSHCIWGNLFFDGFSVVTTGSPHKVPSESSAVLYP